MTGGTGAASKKQVTNAGSQFGNAWADVHPPGYRSSDTNPGPLQGPGNTNRERIGSTMCTRCSAWSGELGSEPTPALFVAHMVEVFREVKRVLRDDGVCFLNIGDSYVSTAPGTRNAPQSKGSRTEAGQWANHRVGLSGSMKPKGLMLVPERLAIALADDGWIVRSRIAWCKAAPMPESVRDRPTSAWEHIWMLTKSGRYFWDQEATKQPLQESSLERGYTYVGQPETSQKMLAAGDDVRAKANWRENGYVPTGANMRNFWVLNPDPYSGAHFATYPRELVRRCVTAATSDYGACAACGAPWARAKDCQPAAVLGEAVRVRREELGLTREQLAQKAGKGSNNVWDWEVGGHIPNGKHWADFAAALDLTLTRDQFIEQAEYITTGRQDGPKRQAADSEFGVYRPYTERKLRLPAKDKGWTPTCKCGPAAGVRPCIVLDPFSGSGTSAFVAAQLGRTGIGVELSAEYIKQARYGRLAQDFLPFDIPEPAKQEALL